MSRRVQPRRKIHEEIVEHLILKNIRDFLLIQLTLTLNVISLLMKLTRQLDEIAEVIQGMQ